MREIDFHENRPQQEINYENGKKSCIFKQKCIPVGCVPAAHWPYARGRGFSLPGGVLPAGGDSPANGGSLPRRGGFSLLGGSLPGGPLPSGAPPAPCEQNHTQL